MRPLAFLAQSANVSVAELTTAELCMKLAVILPKMEYKKISIQVDGNHLCGAKEMGWGGGPWNWTGVCMYCTVRTCGAAPE